MAQVLKRENKWHSVYHTESNTQSSIVIGESAAMIANIQNKSQTSGVTRYHTACLTSTRPWIQQSAAKNTLMRSESK